MEFDGFLLRFIHPIGPLRTVPRTKRALPTHPAEEKDENKRRVQQLDRKDDITRHQVFVDSCLTSSFSIVCATHILAT